MLLENRLLGNVRVFLVIRLQEIKAGLGRRGGSTHFADPFAGE